MKTRLAFPVFVSALFAIACLVFSACSEPVDPRAAPIAAATPEDFNAWKNAVAQKVSPEEMKEFDGCVSEIRLGIMQRREASGVGPIAQKLCEYVNGKTMREVVIMGHTSTVEWVTKELAFQRGNIEKTETALAGPGSEAKKTELRDYLAVAKDNVAKLEARLERAKTRLAELQAEKNSSRAARAVEGRALSCPRTTRIVRFPNQTTRRSSLHHDAQRGASRECSRHFFCQTCGLASRGFRRVNPPLNFSADRSWPSLPTI